MYPKLIGGLAVVMVLIGLSWWMLRAPEPSQTTAQNTKQVTELAPEVERLLTEKMSLLQELATDTRIRSALTASNRVSAQLSSADIDRLDREWQEAQGVTPAIQAFLENDTARALIDFQRMHGEFKEIFVADRYGLNVGQTDKTSDYYQADESWWVEGYNNGIGHAFHGPIEFDESSQTEAIAVYVPVFDVSGKVGGVMKGVIDVSAISGQL